LLKEQEAKKAAVKKEAKSGDKAEAKEAAPEAKPAAAAKVEAKPSAAAAPAAPAAPANAAKLQTDNGQSLIQLMDDPCATSLGTCEMMNMKKKDMPVVYNMYPISDEIDDSIGHLKEMEKKYGKWDLPKDEDAVRNMYAVYV